MRFKNDTSLRLCVFIVCCLLYIYALLEVVIEKCFFNSCLIKLSAKSLKIILKVFIVAKVAGCRPLTLLKLTLSRFFRKWLVNVQLQASSYASNEMKQIEKFYFPLKNVE